MRVKFIGYGGNSIEYPCYEDEKGKLYFDINYGKGDLILYTGAYRHAIDGDICGEPNEKVSTVIECDKPFVRHPREMDYMILGRLKSDCEYFLGNGNGYEGHLYYKSVEKHCEEMERLWNSFSDAEKPQWLTLENIKNYRKQMLNAKEKKTNGDIQK